MLAYIFDTHVIAVDGLLLHFDVVTPERNLAKAIEFASSWLDGMGIRVVRISSHECRYCHQEEASEQIREAFHKFGYYIYQLEGFEDLRQLVSQPSSAALTP